MGKHEKIDQAERERRKALERVFSSVPWLKPREKAEYKAKIFKSGNSLALRLPAGLNLTPGMEMNLKVEDGVFFSFEPIDPPKRKFNIAKVAGSATNLELIDEDDRYFEPRELSWDEPSEG